MGQNSKARRDAKAKARAKAARAATSGATAVRFPAGMGAGAAVGAFLGRREACSECGSRNLRWYPAAEMRDWVSPEHVDRVAEMVEVTGPGAEGWVCSRCAGFGIVAVDAGGFGW